MERRRSHLVWEVRTDFGTVCAGRTAILRKSDRISQVSGHSGVDPPPIGRSQSARPVAVHDTRDRTTLDPLTSVRFTGYGTLQSARHLPFFRSAFSVDCGLFCFVLFLISGTLPRPTLP